MHADGYNNKDLMDRPIQSTVNAILKERGTNYGEFTNHAMLSQKLKEAFHTHVVNIGQPESFTDSMIEAMDMIFHKIARIANGDPLYVDSWQDIAGYAQLIVDELSKDKK
mgnify:FL=1|jgi:hypothetical protein